MAKKAHISIQLPGNYVVPPPAKPRPLLLKDMASGFIPEGLPDGQGPTDPAKDTGPKPR